MQQQLEEILKMEENAHHASEIHSSAERSLFIIFPGDACRKAGADRFNNGLPWAATALSSTAQE